MFIQRHSTLVHTTLFVAVTFVNKYVLSELNFTYPTIFQGWQTLVGALIMGALAFTDQLQFDPMVFMRYSQLGGWVPAMVLYVISIYSGSVALSLLPVPLFLCIHSLLQIVPQAVSIFLHHETPPHKTLLILLVIVISTFLAVITDPKFSVRAYVWAGIHIVSTGGGMAYEATASARVHLGSLEKIYINYLYSVVILAPSTYFLGDAVAAQTFQWWYFYRFYCGCVLSGLFGVGLSVCKVYCTEERGPKHVDLWTSVAKIIAVVFSLGLFNFNLQPINCLWICTNLGAGLILNDMEQTNLKNCKNSTADLENTLENSSS